MSSRVESAAGRAAARPAPRDLRPAQVVSLAVALLMALVAVGGWLSPDGFYPTAELRRAFAPNDVVSLIVGLPALLGSVWLAGRGHLLGWLAWPGALVYVVYNYLAYLIAIPLGLITAVYLALVLGSAYAGFMLVSRQCGSAARQLAGHVPVRTSGGVLIGFGVLFTFRALGVIAQANTAQTALAPADLGTLVADLCLSAVMVAGGGLLLRRAPLGYASGLGLLFAASLLFIGLIVFMLVQPVLTDAPFILANVVVVFGLGLICFIPTLLFIRAVAAIGGRHDSA